MIRTLWFYVRDGKRRGPVEFEHLLSVLFAGQIPASARVWHPGLPEWAAASSIPQISNQLPPPLPPTPGSPGSTPAEAPEGAVQSEPPAAPAPPVAPSRARIDDLRKRLETDASPQLFAELAEELRKDGDLEETIQVCRAGLQKHPDYTLARMTLGRALCDIGDPAAARAEVEAVLRDAPNNLLAMTLLEECLAALAAPPIPLAPAEEAFELASAYELPAVTPPPPPPLDDAAHASEAPLPAPDLPPPPEPAALPSEPDSSAPVEDDAPTEAVPIIDLPATPVPQAPPASRTSVVAAPSWSPVASLPPTGSLAKSDFPDLIRALHERRWTGRIELHRGLVDASVAVQDGRLVFASSTNRDDRLGELLLRREMIQLAQYYDASKAIRKGKRLGSILVEMGALAPQELVGAVVDHTQEIIYGVFLWTEGFYRLREGADTDPETITLKLSTADIILEGIRRITAWSRIERGVGGPKQRYVRSHDWQDELREMTLTPHRLLLLSEHEGERDVETICRESRLSSFEVCRTIWAFRVIGVLKQVPTPGDPPD